MAEPAEETTDSADESQDAEAPSAADEKPRRSVNRTALAIGLGMTVVIVAAVFFSFKFVEDERARNMQEWQIRLGIVADSRAAAVNEWADQNFSALRELTENASLQLYMSELTMGAEEGGAEEGTEAGDEAAEASYLRNLLVASAERSGFKPPVTSGEIAANVEKVGTAGLGITDAEGKAIVSTSDMPPITGKIRKAIATALDGEPALIDVYMGASNLPTIGFALPVFGIQDDGEGAQGIGAVIGIRVIDKGLFERLKQLGDTTQTSETVLARSTGSMVEYISPLADGTEPLNRSMAIDTPDLAAAFALNKPGGFALKRNYAGEEVLVTSRPLAGLPWVVMRSITRAEALSGTETRLKTILTVFVLIIVGVTVTIVAVWRHGSSLRATEALGQARIAAERFGNMSKFMNVVTNSQPTKIIAVSGDTKYTFANEPAAREAGITTKDIIGKTMASVMGPVQAQTFADINREILANFAESNDSAASREQHILTFGKEDDDDFAVIKSDHIPLRGDRDFPPAVLMILDDITDLSKERRRSEKMLNQLIGTLVSVVDRRDPFSAHHSERVAEVAKSIAEEMGATEVEAKTAQISGKLMNLGKIFIPPDLLTKTGNLSPEERSLMENSYLVSVDLLDDVDFDGPVVDTIRQLGETWDGSGPLGMREDEVLLPARILSVANTFVGMVSPRAYRGALTFEKVSSILLDQTTTKFDRKPVSALINFLENRGGAEKWAYFREKPEDVPEDAAE